ncbi:MAG: S46 family peptidase [Bacteroidales bacterium]|nr:S46 family peptidase [Bacteroidales bacterium]
MRQVWLVLLLMVIFSGSGRPDEGMWLPLFIERLNYVDMQKMGLQLTPEEIYSVNHSSLKDAVPIFGRGCTSELISDQGLLLTNHHCGYGLIQSHSSLDHDYLTDGFWAASKEDELANPTLTVRFLVRIEDVTGRVIAAIGDTQDESEREEAIRKVSKEIQEEATLDTHYDASVRSFFAGNEYYLIVYETYRDVRLVGAPPSSIGKFGADTDNWMWPRHTGDFSLFRVYTGKDGKPADYSPDNIPLKPKHYLPVSLDGVSKGDFSFILGYPGSTERYLSSYGVDMAIRITNPTIVNIRDRKLGIMRESMEASDQVRIQYASKYARTSNYWKYYIGQTRGLKRLGVYREKEELESRFTAWCNENPSYSVIYGSALEDINAGYQMKSKVELARVYYSEAIQRGSEILSFAGRFVRLKDMLEKEDTEEQKLAGMIRTLRQQAGEYFKDYHAPTDQKLLAAMLEMYYEDVPMEYQPALFRDKAARFKLDFDDYAAFIFSRSLFSQKERTVGLLEKPSARAILKDPAFELITVFEDHYSGTISPVLSEADSLLSRGYRKWIAGLREMQPEQKFYPDANFTMRLTYGQVLDYYPADAVHYEYYTSLTGVMEKEDPDNWEFVVPQKLKDLYANQDFGPYGENGTMRVCFITNHDITGGNSGSPVLNGKGELIGLAFDGNWEAMSGDIAFEPDLQRTINVDIRYVLFIIDKYAGASHLIDEMTLVRKRAAPSGEKVKQDKPAMEKTPDH